MNAKFYPATLSGKTQAQALKPLAMRYFTLAFFAKGQTKIYLKNETEDFSALKDALIDLGATVTRENSVYTVTPPENPDYSLAELDVKTSLSAFRFLLPTLSAKYLRVDFTGSGKLTRKDIVSGMSVLKGVTLNSKSIPLTAYERLKNGEFMLEPELNSQIVCSLIMALPMLEGDSLIKFREKPKRQLGSLISLTISAMAEFGVKVEKIESGLKIQGGQSYVPPQNQITVEGDYGSAGYFLALNLLGGSVQVDNLKEDSVQPEKDIVKYLSKLSDGEREIALKGKTDFIFLLTALSSVKPNTVKFTGVKIKEKDKEKFSEFSAMLNRLGASVSLDEQTLTVCGKDNLKGGVMLDSLGDSRVAMSLIVLSSVLDSPVTLLSVESAMTEQSSFINEFVRLGGKCEVV